MARVKWPALQAIEIAGADAETLASAYTTLGTVLAHLGRFDEMERSFAQGKECMPRPPARLRRSAAGITTTPIRSRGSEAKSAAEAMQREGLEALTRLGVERSGAWSRPNAKSRRPGA